MTQAATNNAGSNGPPQRPSTQAEYVPPHDLDAEKALLGAMMMDVEAISSVVPLIQRNESRWFYLPAHQQIFELLLDLYDDANKAIDLIVVTDELRRRDLLDFVGGQDYMILLAESFADWANAEHYARIVRDKGLLRDLIRTLREVSTDAFAAVQDTREIFDFAEQKIFEVTEKRVSGHAIPVGEAMRRLREQLDSDAPTKGFPTGFAQLDEQTSGFQPGDMIVIAGRPSMGKTSLGLCMAQTAVLQNRPVAFFSMEMSADQIAQRLVCSYGHGIDANKLRKRMLDEADKRSLLDAWSAYEDAPLYIDDTPGMTVMELRSKARRIKKQFNVEAIFVDYIQLMHSPRAESRQVEVANISRGIKSIARELQIPIIALAQLNRASESRSDKRPMMGDLRESGAIEQDADVVLLIHREEYYAPNKDDIDINIKGMAELIIAKQRNGPTGSVKLQFNRRFTRFSNYSPEGEPYPVLDSVSPF